MSLLVWMFSVVPAVAQQKSASDRLMEIEQSTVQPPVGVGRPIPTWWDVRFKGTALVEGRFEFVSGQLRDIQLYQHAKFSQIDGRLDKIDGRLDKSDARLDRIEKRLDDLTAEVRALPRAIAELIAKR